MKISKRGLVTIVALWPSYKFFAGVFGATPFGALITPFYRISSRDKIYFGLLAIIIATGINDFTSVKEAALLLLGPSVFLLMKNITLRDENSFDNIIKFTMIILTIDAIFLGFSGLRGGTYLTLEPSHSARLFYSLIIFRLIISATRTNVFWMLVFLFANKSMFAALFTLIYLNYLFFYQATFKQKMQILSIFVTTVTLLMLSNIENRFTRHFSTVFKLVQTSDVADLVFLSNAIGSRRITQSLGGYILADESGYGLGRAREKFVEVSEGSSYDVTGISRIKDKGGGPTSWYSQVTFELGVIRALLIAFIFGLWIRFRFSYWACVALFLLLLTSTTTMPSAWCILGVALNKNARYNKENHIS